MSELTFKFKNDSDDKLRHSQTFLLHEIYTTSQDDPVIQRCLAEALKSITWKPEEINYTIKAMVV